MLNALNARQSSQPYPSFFFRYPYSSRREYFHPAFSSLALPEPCISGSVTVVLLGSCHHQRKNTVSMFTTTKPDDSVQEKTTPAPTTPTILSPKAASQNSTFPGKGKIPEHRTSTPPSRSISRNSSRQPTQRSPGKSHEADEAAWGSNFWVTLVDPQVCTQLSLMDTAMLKLDAMLDTNILLCLSGDRTSELGPSCRTFCVMLRASRLLLELTLDTDYHRALKENGGSLVTNRAVAYHTTTRPRLEALSGSAPKAS